MANHDRVEPVAPTCLAVALLLVAGATGAAVQTYSSAPAAVIPDAGPPGPGTPQSVTDSLVVADSGTINDLDLTVTLQHPGHGDLSIELTDPSGAVTVRVINTEGGPGDGFSDVTFDDEAAGLPPGFVVNGTCLVNQTYQPAPGSLADFDGLELSGTWTLTVTDHFTSDASDCDCDGFVVGPSCPRTLDVWSITVDFDGPDGDDDEAPELGCREVLLLLLLILVLLGVLWLLIRKGRP